MRKTICLCVLVLAYAVDARAKPIGAVLDSIPTPGPCTTGLAWDGKFLWAADHKTDTLYKLDPRDGRVVARISAPGYRPAGLAWDGRHLWNVDPLAQKLFRVDVARRVVDRTVDAPVPEARALGWDGKHLWLASARKARLHRIDRGDGTTIDSHTAPSRSVEGLAHDGRYLWITDRLADQLHVVDPGGGEVLFSVKAPGPHVTGVAFDGKHLWVADYQTDRIYRLEHRGDGKPVRTLKKRQRVLFTHQLRNLGPGKVLEANVFMAMPRDNLSQTLRGVRFTPALKEVVGDQWGQWVAHFRFENIAPGTFATVTMQAEASLYDVRHQVYPHRVRGHVPARVRRYLVDGSKYLRNDPVIRKAVKKAVGKERNPYWIARRIYRYVHQRMFYKLSGGWNVAPRVLARGNGSCSEYSFVFISMCRAAGIPARYIGSLVVRKDDASFDDVYHRWVEIYLPGYGWLPVDPSRGDKKSEVKRADAFGHLEPVFLITTQGGGGSTYLGWRYNSDERWVCKGRCEVQIETIAEWDRDTRHSRSQKRLRKRFVDQRLSKPAIGMVGGRPVIGPLGDKPVNGPLGGKPVMGPLGDKPVIGPVR